MDEGQRVRRVDDEVEEDEQQGEEEYAVAVGVVRLAVLDLCFLEVAQLAVYGGPVGSLQKFVLEGLGNLSFYLREDHNGQILMHDLHDPTILLEEVQPRRFLGQLVLGIVLQHFVDLEPQRQHHFLLLAEL